MEESKTFRRAFAIGLMTLGVALGGQLATSTPAAARCSLPHGRPSAARILFARVAPRAESGLAQRVARAVIGAMLGGLA
jgi:hypothetical protein